MDKDTYKEKQLELVKKYPHVFKLFYTGSNHGEHFWGCQLWGLECDSGWLDLIDRCSKEIEEEILKLPEEEREHYHAVQIKEKFGGLRYYLSCETGRMTEIISKYEDESYKTCEACGACGEVRSGGWIRTLCDSCSGTKE